jgi:hypothetical protein
MAISDRELICADGRARPWLLATISLGALGAAVALGKPRC